MVSNVIFGDLITFTTRVVHELKVPIEKTTIVLKNGNRYEASLPMNPSEEGTAILLVPTDILRELPIAASWDEVGSAAAHNEQFRQAVNRQIADIWERKTREGKGDLKRLVLSSKSSFDGLLGLLKRMKPSAYDMEKDPSGELAWRRIAATIAEREPAKLVQPKKLDIDGVVSVVEQIIRQFQFLIEKRRLSRELYGEEGKPRNERSAQHIFFAVAYAYCKANNIDITPEAETGNGPVDFKASQGFDGRVLVEIKLSINNLTKGYERQEMYREAEETTRAFYIVIDVGGNLDEKAQELLALKKRAGEDGRKASEIIFVNGTVRPSASKL